MVFPLQWKEDNLLAVYSLQQDLNEIKLPDSWIDIESVSVYRVTAEGNNLVKNVRNKNNKIFFKIQTTIPYLLKPKKYK